MSHKTTVFLASSSELKAERSTLELRINRKNKQWHDDGVFLHLEIWEDFIDAMSRTRLQDEYDTAIRRADIFVLLVHTKVGKYSAEEFEVAHAHFKEHGRPLIYTYVKNPPGPADNDPGSEYGTVRALRQRLAALGHFDTRYSSVEELLDHFTQQLDKLRAKGFIQAKPDAATAATPPYRAVVHGSGAVAQGPGAQAVGAGGVMVGGGNYGSINTGHQTAIHTGGGAHVGGNVNVQGGDFVGRDKIVHTPTALPRQDLASLFQALRTAVEARAAVPEKSIAAAHVEAIQEEVAKPAPQRDDGRLARLLDGMVDLVPAGVGAVTSAFATPLLGAVAGPLTAAVLERFKKG